MIVYIKLGNEGFVPITKYSYGEEMRHDNMGGACMTHGRNNKFMKKFVLKT